jgi:hypothetical protein
LPDLVFHLHHPHPLPSQHRAEHDFFAVHADAATLGDHNRPVMKRIRQANSGSTVY